MSNNIDDADREVTSNAANSDIWEAFFRKYRSLEADASNVGKHSTRLYDAFYMNEINELMSKQASTIFVSFEHINDAISLGNIIAGETVEESHHALGRLVHTILFEPDAAKLQARIAAYRILNEMHPSYAKELGAEFAVQFTEIGIHIEIPDVNHTQEGQLISIEGFVTMVDEKHRKDTIESTWLCPNSDETVVKGDKKPAKCDYCTARHLEPMPEKEKKNTIRDFELQQRYDRTGDGRMAMPISVRMVGKDMVNLVKGGDFVEINGIVRTRKVGKGTDSTSMFYIEASSIKQKSDDQFMNVFQRKTAFLEEQVKHAINPETVKADYEKCIQSIAPSIYGHEIMKEALLLQLIGSKAVTLPDRQKFRGNLAILFCGDPATGKSVLGRNVGILYPRQVYVNCQSTTKVGLTASAMRQEGVVRLEAGAYLLARGGLVILDELQLLGKEEKGTLLQVMDDNQEMAIQKGTFHTKTPLKADCCTLALGNPLDGRWDRMKNIYENTGLRPENVSRFDLIFVFTDNPDSEEDQKKTEHWLKHLGKGIANEEYDNAGQEYIRRIQEIEDEGIIHTMQFMAYLVRYIRSEFVPKVKYDYQSPAINKVKRFYLAMRKIDGNLFAPTKDDIKEGREIPKVPAVGPRQLAALIRLTMASAACHFRTELTEEDADIAIKLMEASLTSSGFTTTEDIRRKSWMTPAAKHTKLGDFDILRRATKIQKDFHREVLKKYGHFERLIKELGFRKCIDCKSSGVYIVDDGHQSPCEVCHGRGGDIAEISINELIGYLQVARWTQSDIKDAIDTFKKAGLIETGHRHPSYLEISPPEDGGNWTYTTLWNTPFVDSVVKKKEDEKEYGVDNYEQAQNTPQQDQSSSGSGMTTAYDTMYSTGGQEINLHEEYQKANPEEMAKYEAILQQVEEEENQDESSQTEVQSEEEI